MSKEKQNHPKQNPPKQKLTRSAIDAIPLPPSGRQYHYDSTISGLCICISSAGSRTWYLYRKVNGRPVRLKLGRYPDVSPEAARRLATEAAGRMAGGEDIAATRRAKRNLSQTWSQLFARYIEEHAKLHKKTWKEDQASAKRYLSDWDDIPLNKFNRPMVQDVFLELGEYAPTAANRLLALVSTVFNFADQIGVWNGRNPASGIKRFRETSRDRFVSPSEMPKLISAINEYPNPMLRDFFLLSLMLGARRANVMQMQWKDLDLDRGVWRIPQTKSGEAAICVIPPQAQEILLNRKSICESEGDSSCPWVFPSSGKSGHLVEPKKAWATICKTAGIANLRIHDLRRTFGSWQAIAGTSLPIIGSSLGHRTTSATAIYARLHLDPVRESVSAAISAMMAAAAAQQQQQKEQQDQ